MSSAKYLSHTGEAGLILGLMETQLIETALSSKHSLGQAEEFAAFKASSGRGGEAGLGGDCLHHDPVTPPEHLHPLTTCRIVYAPFISYFVLMGNYDN